MRLAVRVDEDVVRLEITVNHSALMGVAHRAGDLREEFQDPRDRRRLLGDVAVQRHPVHVAHHEEQAIVLGEPAVEDGHDVRVIEVGDEIDLALETPALLPRGVLTVQQQLDGDEPVRRYLAGLIHDPLPAFVDAARDLVAGQIGRGGRGERAPAGGVHLVQGLVVGLNFRQQRLTGGA